MINPNFFLGYPVNFYNICSVYPPKIKDILNENSFAIYKTLLLNSQEDIEDIYVEKKIQFENLPTPLEFLFNVIEDDPKTKNLVISAFKFFIKEEVTLLIDQQIIIVGNLEEELQKVSSVSDLRMLNEENFFEFQNLLRAAIGEKTIEPYDPNENEKIKYFKAKARYRDRIKAKNSKNSLDFGSSLAAICCMNLGLNPLNIGELSYVSFPVLVRYYQEKTKYEIDIRSLLAGADKKKVKPKNWIRNIEDL